MKAVKSAAAVAAPGAKIECTRILSNLTSKAAEKRSHVSHIRTSETSNAKGGKVSENGDDSILAHAGRKKTTATENEEHERCAS